VCFKKTQGDYEMASITQPLRDKHKAFSLQVETLRLAGDVVNESLTTLAHDKIEQSYNFLTRQLLPHTQAEDKTLYPMIQKAMGDPRATATMSRDHLELDRLTQELGTLRVHKSTLSITFEQVNALRRILYGLYALVKLHFAKEEEIYLPLLDSTITAEEAQAMFKEMEVLENEAKARLPR
jgi:iron-sulfur cluster repair protein YtfE (RIC family)